MTHFFANIAKNIRNEKFNKIIDSERGNATTRSKDPEKSANFAKIAKVIRNFFVI